MYISDSPLEMMPLKSIKYQIDLCVKEQVLYCLAQDAAGSNLQRIPMSIFIEAIDPDFQEIYNDDYHDEDEDETSDDTEKKEVACVFRVFGRIVYPGATKSRAFQACCEYDYETKDFSCDGYAVFFSDRTIPDLFEEDIKKKKK